MAVIPYANSTIALNSQIYPSSFLQAAGGLNERYIIRLDAETLPTLIEKTPAEIVGEKILRPLIDKMSNLLSPFFSLTRYLPSLPSLPGADAKEIRPTDKVYVHFPSQEILQSCLDDNSLITPWMREKGVTRAVANSFANMHTVPMGVGLGVMLTLESLQEKLGFPDTSFMPMGKNIAKALEECMTDKADSSYRNDL